MTDRQETSRHWILDAVECIKNCEAIVSHCNEIMDSIYENITTNDKIYDKYKNLLEMRTLATNTRRRVMRKVYDAFPDSDHDYRCILKHAIEAKWFIDEVAAADDNTWIEETEDMYKLMSLALSSFIWVEPKMCARCMADDLLSDNDNENE